MKLYEFHSANNYFLLTEEERTAKTNTFLDMLADGDLELILGELSESKINEVDPRNPNAYQPKSDKLTGGIRARYPERFTDKDIQVRNAEIVPAVKELPKKEKSALFDLVKKELAKRQAAKPAKDLEKQIKQKAKAEARAQIDKAKAELAQAKKQAKSEEDARKAKEKIEAKARTEIEKLQKKAQQELEKSQNAQTTTVKEPAKPSMLKKIVKGLGKLALVGAISVAAIDTGMDHLSDYNKAQQADRQAAQQAAAQAAADAEAAKTPEQKEMERLKSQINNMRSVSLSFATEFTKRDGWDVDMFGHDLVSVTNSDSMKYNALKDGRSLDELSGIKPGNGSYTWQIDVDGPKDVTTVISFTNYKIDKVKINGKSYDISRYGYDIRELPK